MVCTVEGTSPTRSAICRHDETSRTSPLPTPRPARNASWHSSSHVEQQALELRRHATCKVPTWAFYVAVDQPLWELTRCQVHGVDRQTLGSGTLLDC